MAKSVSGPRSGMETLGEILAHQISPRAWATVLDAIVGEELAAFWSGDSGASMANAIMLMRSDAMRVCSERAQYPLPTGSLSANTAGPIMAVKEAALTSAQNEGILPDFTFRSLIELRQAYVFPSEIKTWSGMHQLAFRNRALRLGLAPVYMLAKTNFWNRSDIEQSFPESVEMRFYREWCH